MTNPTSTPGGFTEPDMYRILTRACNAVGLDSSDASLLRGHTNAVILLDSEQVVVKIARRGSRVDSVERTVHFVSGLMEAGFPTVPLHRVEQPVLIDHHPVTFWDYLPQPDAPVSALQLAEPLRALHQLPLPAQHLPRHDNIRAIRKSIAATTSLPQRVLRFLSDQADRLEAQLKDVEFPLRKGVIQGDPQHRNALHTRDGGVVLCDWDTVAIGQPEWDLTTVEVHCRRFGYGHDHYQAFADAYGFDVQEWSGYPTVARIRELRMVTTNARKSQHTPGSLAEVERRVEGLRNSNAQLQWRIL